MIFVNRPAAVFSAQPTVSSTETKIIMSDE